MRNSSVMYDIMMRQGKQCCSTFYGNVTYQKNMRINSNTHILLQTITEEGLKRGVGEEKLLQGNVVDDETKTKERGNRFHPGFSSSFIFSSLWCITVAFTCTAVSSPESRVFIIIFRGEVILINTFFPSNHTIQQSPSHHIATTRSMSTAIPMNGK